MAIWEWSLLALILLLFSQTVWIFHSVVTKSPISLLCFCYVPTVNWLTAFSQFTSFLNDLSEPTISLIPLTLVSERWTEHTPSPVSFLNYSSTFVSKSLLLEPNATSPFSYITCHISLSLSFISLQISKPQPSFIINMSSLYLISTSVVLKVSSKTISLQQYLGTC